jgi:hypothetical protein
MRTWTVSVGTSAILFIENVCRDFNDMEKF